jgi:hypothetical protein
MIFYDDSKNNNADSLLNIISIILGYENLVENRQQSAHNDIEKHNQKQERHILDELHKQFDMQNQTLEHQNHLLKEILNILKGENKNEL